MTQLQEFNCRKPANRDCGCLKLLLQRIFVRDFEGQYHNLYYASNHHFFSKLSSCNTAKQIQQLNYSTMTTTADCNTTELSSYVTYCIQLSCNDQMLHLLQTQNTALHRMSPVYSPLNSKANQTLTLSPTLTFNTSSALHQCHK